MIRHQTSGYYSTKLNENKGWIIICGIFAIVITFISYPGFFYTDSEARVIFANRIEEIIQSYWSGNPIETSSWLTVIPQFFIYASIKITGGIGLYTFLQAFFLFMSVVTIFKQINQKHYLFLVSFIFCLPLFYCNGVFYEMSIGCLIGILFLYNTICSFNLLYNKIDYIFWMVNIAFWSFVTFGYRANAITILPIILLIILIKIKGHWKYFSTVFLFSGLALTLVLPKILHIDTMSSGSAGIAWEIVMTIKHLPENQRELYIDYLDEIGGEGSTKEAIKSITERNVCSLTSTRINGQKLSKEGVNKVIIKKYLELFMNEPKAWIRTKMYIICGTLGINKPLDHVAWIYDQYGRMKNYCFNDSIARYRFYQSYMDNVKLFNICLRPIILYLLGLFIGIIFFFLQKKRGDHLQHIENEIWLYLISLFYYSAYCLNTQAFELRYFYPSFLMLVIAEISVILKMGYVIIEKRKLHLYVSRNYNFIVLLLIIIMCLSFHAFNADNLLRAADLTDRNWTDGILNIDNKTILFRNTSRNYAKLKASKKIFYEGGEFNIIKLDSDSLWIRVNVDRDATRCAFPSVLKVK